MILDFSGLRVLVTGGAGGIGIEICRELHALGAEVVVHYHRSKLQAEDLAKEIGGSAIQADLTKEEDVLNLFKQIENLHGSLDCCVANAGKYPTESLPAWEISGDRLAETLDLNLKVTFYTSQEFLRRAVERKRGSLVLVGSTAGVHGERGHADYACAKGAITSGLLKTLKNDIAGTGVRVNAVAPGWTLTESKINDGLDDSISKTALKTMSIKKLATPKDVASAVSFLLHDGYSGHISGQVLEVSGGMEGRIIPGVDG
tara:strand:- start:1487 stop:2263 length:777 start_codon:yes stop_codon:yes gene_type:complete